MDAYNPYYSEVSRSSPPPMHKPLRHELPYAPKRRGSGPPPKMGYYPATLFLLIGWIVFVAFMLWLIEMAVKNGPARVKQPWYYTTLPSILFTIFAQGHVGISALHLSRLSVSALHSARTSPNTWAEVFFISDGNWQGPWGLLQTFRSAYRMRIGVSLHFVVCALICLIGLATPIALGRAYPIDSIIVNQNVRFNPATLSTEKLTAVDGYSQIGTGIGSWTSTLSVTEAYNSSVYLQPNVTRTADPQDFFFAGDVEGRTLTLPGLRVQGQCTLVENNPVKNFTDEFAAFCKAQIPILGDPNSAGGGFISTPVSLTELASTVEFQGCADTNWGGAFPKGSQAESRVGFFYFRANNGSNIREGIPFVNREGLVRCDERLSTGRAKLTGADGTYTDFVEERLLANEHGAEPIQSPLYAFMYYFDSAQKAQRLSNPMVSSSIIQALGFTPISYTFENITSAAYAAPTNEEIAARLWRGAVFMSAGVGLLARSNATEYDAIEPGVTAVYVRDWEWFAVSYALLVAWLLLLVFATTRSFRRTFGSSFDSYLTAKLVVDQPNLVADDNLREKFGRVGTNEFGEVVVVDTGK
ncbi:hypothetical protein MKEN_01026900 [Mycena kentingensis (nom. inval.)]|nr:hypothetical protein MKEN_01026900 [Mycena kentingensis (nom. inval.)]